MTTTAGSPRSAAIDTLSPPLERADPATRVL